VQFNILYMVSFFGFYCDSTSSDSFVKVLGASHRLGHIKPQHGSAQAVHHLNLATDLSIADNMTILKNWHQVQQLEVALTYPKFSCLILFASIRRYHTLLFSTETPPAPHSPNLIMPAALQTSISTMERCTA